MVCNTTRDIQKINALSENNYSSNLPIKALGLIPFWQAFLFWLKLGFISFGGPSQSNCSDAPELVEQKRWISEKIPTCTQLLHVLPGPEAQQLAIYIGWLMHRTAGGLVAGILFVLPSLFILIALSWIYVQFGDVPIIAGLILLASNLPVTAIVFHATYRIGSRSLKNNFLYLIAAAAFIAIFFFNIPFPLIVLSAAILGYLLSKKQPHFATQSTHQGKQKHYGAALIDDDTPPPAHAIFPWTQLTRNLTLSQRSMVHPNHRFNPKLRMATCLYPIGMVLYQGCITHIWWSLCRITFMCIKVR